MVCPGLSWLIWWYLGCLLPLGCQRHRGSPDCFCRLLGDPEANLHWPPLLVTGDNPTQLISRTSFFCIFRPGDLYNELMKWKSQPQWDVMFRPFQLLLAFRANWAVIKQNTLVGCVVVWGLLKRGLGGGWHLGGRVGRSVLMRELMKTQGVIRQFWDGWEYVGQVTSTWNPKQPV